MEDELLEIVKNNPKEKFNEIIAEKKSWPIFYHLSPFRANIIDWLPIGSKDKVLEIGSGCGAITGALAKKAESVTCIDLSKKRSLVNAYRNKEYGNITIKVGNFKDIEPSLDTDFDYVLLIGVFEYGQSYIGGDTPYEDFMRICNRHKKESGRLVIAIENKFGLKYWAGCQEDHLGKYFAGLCGYKKSDVARTFTRRGLEKIMESAQVGEYSFYYPYPDYKFMSVVYSDERLPQKGELSNNLRNFDRERALLFDERQVFDQILDEDEFALFSNSYLVVIGKKPDITYAKFSNDRASKYAIQTRMAKNPDGVTEVQKLPCTEEAKAHIENMQRAYGILSERYAGTRIDINRYRKIEGGGIGFEFCSGKTLESLLDECLDRGDMQGFRALIDEYMKWLSYGDDNSAATNIDFIFPNILVDGDRWHIIDYEWTFYGKLSARDIAFRAFYNYALGGEGRERCRELLFGEILGLSDDEVQKAVGEESRLQSDIGGSGVSVDGMREVIGNRAYEFSGMLELCRFADNKYMAQLFYDYGEGFSEENSEKLQGCFAEEKYLSIVHEIPENVLRVRIDPCSYACAANIQSVKLGDKTYSNDELEINGFWHPCGSVVFDTDDPNITINADSAHNGRLLQVKMEVVQLLPELAKSLRENMEAEKAANRSAVDRAKGRIKKMLK